MWPSISPRSLLGRSRQCAVDAKVKLLVDAKANLNAKNSKGLTPLSVAVLKGRYYIDTRMITPVLDAGAEVRIPKILGKSAVFRPVGF